MIDDFCSAWFNLTEMFVDSKTPKLHILIDHLEDYFHRTDATLIKTRDQLCEKMHQHLNNRPMCSFYIVKDVTNPMVKDNSELYST